MFLSRRGSIFVLCIERCLLLVILNISQIFDISVNIDYV